MSSRTIDTKKAVAHIDNGSSNPTDDDSGDARPPKDDGEDLEKLRNLIVRTEGVSDVLPSAVTDSTRRRKGELARATLPIVEENIRQSATKDPKILAEALFPVIGPAIRKAIAEALSSMVQTLNQTLEHSVSPQSLSWRFEAWRTGKSFGEVVMLRTMLYRVEQVFLIHSETGILLEHVAANPNDTKDADMVSAMLTAIKDFVRDSFETKENAKLDALRMEELSVWIEHSPDALLAVVIRGNPPYKLRQTFEESIEEIQYDFENDLMNFDGDTAPFRATRPILERCLLSKSNTDEREDDPLFSPTRILLGTLSLIILAALVFVGWQYWNWANYLQSLRNEPGIVLTETEFGLFHRTINGLRDPLARPIDVLETNYGYESGDIIYNLKPYIDANSAFIVARATRLLQPPKDVTLKYQNGVLTATGNVDSNWFAESEKLALAVGGVSRFENDNGRVFALEKEIAQTEVQFACNSIDLTETGRTNIRTLSGLVSSLATIAPGTQLNVIGNSSNTGDVASNRKFRNKRAAYVRQSLIDGSDEIKMAVTQNPNFLKVQENMATSQNNGCIVTISPTK
ncbi:MAG: hypothetical protein ACK5NT_07105 [Pyrinomonadaceae bacterium]